MVDALLIISIFLLVYLSAYALIFLGLSFFAFWPRLRSKTPLHQTALVPDRGAIAVLIPSHNEGEGLIDAVETVLRQDYRGKIDVYILLNDQANNPNEIKALTDFYHFDFGLSAPTRSGNFPLILNKNNRKVYLVLSACQAKKDKINHILPNLYQPYAALLDADHRPATDWLSSSLRLLSSSGAAAIQTRRRPLSTSRLAQIWDSSQNHLGNELFNNFLTKILARRGGRVFFTGTAALFKTEILKRFGLSDSVTEDTDLSYRLWCAGEIIAYNGDSVSYEEVSPSFRDYVMRRRRWSAGHSRTFFRHIIKIIKSPLSLLEKLVILGHGQFYLIPLAVWLLLSVYGYYFFGQLGTNFQLAVALASFVFAFFLSYGFRQKGRRLYGDWLVAFLWLLPQLAVIAVYAYKFSGAENYYYILIFPYAKDWLLWHLALISAPLLAFLASFYFFRDARQWQSLWVIPTYLITMALDVYACLLGFWDMVFGRSYWSRISRRNDYSAQLVAPEMSAGLVTGQATPPSRRLPYVLALAALAALVILNDLLAVNNCGEIKKFLWTPLFLKPKSAVNLKINVAKKPASGQNLALSVYATVTGGSGHFSLDYYIDDKLAGKRQLAGELSAEPLQIIEAEYPLGWQKHKLEVRLQGQGSDIQTTCNRRTAFSTVLKEIRGTDLYINGEKFLIKGLIPSFMNGQIDLGLEEGFRQFQAIGANTIRFYHTANPALLAAAASSQLLVIDQPDRSTWNELDLTSERQIDSYLDRYEEMVRDHAGEPYLLWDGLGNEWELGNKADGTTLIKLTDETLRRAARTVYNWPSSYSTYFTFINYPTDISGINMLDTGLTYWDRGIKIIKSLHKPFYASEFGGFVAFWEKTVPEIRMKRLADDWAILLQDGALGANFYESHDNWAQPVVVGYNDPFEADQPDDTRGFWDHDNKAKPELRVLKKLLADLEVKVKPETISAQAQSLPLLIKNIREYDLKQTILSVQGRDYDLGDIKSGEEKEIAIDWQPQGTDPSRLALAFRYTSHAGLGGAAQVDLILPVIGQTPLVLNDDFSVESNGPTKLSGRLLSSDKLDLVLPADWSGFRLNGQAYSRSADRLAVPLANPYQPVAEPEISRDGKDWTKLEAGFQPGFGRYYFRFRWPETRVKSQYLVLSGLGSGQAEISGRGQTKRISVHNYRENVIEAASLGDPQPGDLITISLYRGQSAYIDKEMVRRDFQVETALSENTDVEFELPRVFAPADIVLEKAD
jgi:cellulose synthase/poly-beta-1,6-N-acetylglucosamine synthase-like glycosyltransferase